MMRGNYPRYTLDGERMTLQKILSRIYVSDRTLRRRARKNGTTVQEEIDNEWWRQKAQEAVEPRKRVNHNGFTYYHCGRCDAVLMAFQPKYCHKCGQAVKWDA